MCSKAASQIDYIIICDKIVTNKHTERTGRKL